MLPGWRTSEIFEASKKFPELNIYKIIYLIYFNFHLIYTWIERDIVSFKCNIAKINAFPLQRKSTFHASWLRSNQFADDFQYSTEAQCSFVFNSLLN